MMTSMFALAPEESHSKFADVGSEKMGYDNKPLVS